MPKGNYFRNADNKWEHSPWSFSDAIARNIFAHILKFVKFDDISSRDQRRENDKHPAIREGWDWFVENCKKLSESFEDLTVDEKLVAFRGICPMR